MASYRIGGTARSRTTWLRATRAELEDDQGDPAGEYRDERVVE
jgi:hypothetical protein